MIFDSQAQELNAIIEENNRGIFDVLSQRGKESYFPQNGILAQSAAAANCKINATIGIALEEDKSTACLPCLAELIQLNSSELSAFQYAPSSGLKELREIWQKMMIEKNPPLKNIPISLPITTSALTHGLYIAAQMFLDSNDSIIFSDYFWENYKLVLCRSTGAQHQSFSTFTDNGKYNIDGLRDSLSQGGAGKKVLLLNFPNNPTGYTPTAEEAKQIRDVLIEEAKRGSNIAVIIDDAYFGLVFEDDIFTQSLFSLLADAHENILAIKCDGATKEDYAWGLRAGFLTFGVKGGNAKLYNALEQKTAGFIREQISSASRMSQLFLIRAYKHPNYNAEKQKKYDLLKKRYEKVKEILAENRNYGDYFTALPFNSGYFMCVKLKDGIDAEKVRELLVKKYSIGVIQMYGVLRVAFSSTPTDELSLVFDSIFNCCKELEETA